MTGHPVPELVQAHGLRALLLELALAVELEVVFAHPAPRARKALDRAFELVDPTGAYRRAARKAAGCAICKGPLDSGDHDICGPCADKVPELAASI